VAEWRTQAPFMARVRELRGEMISRAAGALADSMGEGARVLRKLLSSRSEATRLRAAQQLIELALKVTSAAELEARLAALEQRIQEGQ
jgi:hypothetical protein